MEDVIGIIVAPIIIFMIFVAPIWLIMHYRSKKQMNQGLTEAEYGTLQELANPYWLFLVSTAIFLRWLYCSLVYFGKKASRLVS